MEHIMPILLMEAFVCSNDQTIAAQFLLDQNLAKDFDNDLDVHQGNGTAEIFQNNSSVLPFQLMEKTITLSRKKPLI
jgi:acetoin utilization deacetylase AcuC-like enzyme